MKLILLGGFLLPFVGIVSLAEVWALDQMLGIHYRTFLGFTGDNVVYFLQSLWLLGLGLIGLDALFNLKNKKIVLAIQNKEPQP